MSSVALVLPYKLCEGPQVYLQLHTNGKRWRLFGGHLENGETQLDAVVREAREELYLELNRQEMGEGWTVPQLLCRMRVKFRGIYIFPIEVDNNFLHDGIKVGEGLKGQWWPVKALPSNMSVSDKLLIKIWVLRRFVFNQSYIITPLQCPIVTVDLEEPHHYAGRCNNGRFLEQKYGLEPVIKELLKHLEDTGTKATFFCVVSTAKKYQKLIHSIVQEGHEVASHGTNHQLADIQTLAQFRKDVSDSKKALEDMTQQKIKGYRAPGWSWPRDPTQRARYYETLRNAEYLYDSSVIPSAIIGITGVPSLPYKTETGVWEFPLPTFGIPCVTKNLDLFAKDGNYFPPSHVWRESIRIPYSGGLFFRCIGPYLSRLILSYHLKKKGYAMTYIHPRELSGQDASWIKGMDDRYLNLFERWCIGFRTRGLKKHFFSLLANYSGCSIQQFLYRTL